MKTLRNNIVGYIGITIVYLLVISGCQPVEPSPNLDAQGVWFDVQGSVNFYITAGDTLKGIAKTVNVPLNTLLELNNLEKNATIYAGDSLTIGNIDPYTAVAFLPNLPSIQGEGRDFVEIEQVDVVFAQGESKPLISLEIYGQLFDECIELLDHKDTVTQTQSEHSFYISITPVHLFGSECTGNSSNFSRTVELAYEYLHAGEYELEVNGYRSSFTLEEAAGTYPPVVNTVANLVWDEISDRFNAVPEIIKIEVSVWADSCLDLGQEGESCDEIETHGYSLIAIEGERTWVYHTNQDGSELRGYESDDSSLQMVPRSMPATVKLDFLPAVSVRSCPEIDCPVIGQLENGSVFAAIGISPNGGWLLILLPGFDENTSVWLNMQLTDFTDDVHLPVVEYLSDTTED